MATSHRSSPQKYELPFERAIQLRKEAVAAMKLRSGPALRCFLGSQSASNAVAPKRESRQARILAISDYEGLRTSREQVLRQEGFQVESVTSQTLMGIAWVRSFDIAIFCQSVERVRAVRLADLLRRYNSKIVLLRITPQAIHESGSWFDFEMEAFAGPCGLLSAIEMIEQKMANR